MELYRSPEENSNTFELASRESLFKLLYFLEQQPPPYYGIHMFVRAALLTSDPTFQVYFSRRHNQTSSSYLEEDDYTAIVGTQCSSITSHDQQPAQKNWNITSWAFNEEYLPTILQANNEIDWVKDGLYLYFTTPEPHPAIANFLTSKRGIPHTRLNRFFLPVKNALNIQLSCPGDVYVKSLERCDAQLILDHWPYKEFVAADSVALGIDQFPSAGVYLKENDKLVSWATILPPGGISRLNTLENYRKRGYAKLAVQYISKRMAQSGYFPFAHVLPDNEASASFFRALGFELDCSCHYYLSHHNVSIMKN